MEFAKLSQLYDALEQTTKKLQKQWLVSLFLQECTPAQLPVILLLLQGRVFPVISQKNLGVSTQTVLKALQKSTGYTVEELTHKWKILGDLGLVASECISKKKQQTFSFDSLSVEYLVQTLTTFSDMSGVGTIELKIQRLASIYAKATPSQAKYVTRIVLEVMRVGVGDGVLRDSLVWAYYPPILPLWNLDPGTQQYVPVSIRQIVEEPSSVQCDTVDKSPSQLVVSQTDPVALDVRLISYIQAQSVDHARLIYSTISQLVESAFSLTTDFGEISVICQQKRFDLLQTISPIVGRPLRCMLAKKATTITHAIQMVGLPCAIEYKYDGFRGQIHKNGKTVRIFTRRLDDVTTQFPDVVKAIQESVICESCILDSEIIGFDPVTQKSVPFQEISTRIRRKYDIDSHAIQTPIQVHIFDIIALNSKSLIQEPFVNRRSALNTLLSQSIHTQSSDQVLTVKLSEYILAQSEQEILTFYEKSLSAGNEGIMAKSLQSLYIPGSRVGSMVKIKPVMDTLDLVITKAYWGEGKRTSSLTSFTLACLDADTGELVEIGNVGTGFKEESSDDLSFSSLTAILEPLILSTKDREVVLKPQVVLEIAYEEIQKSESYSSGFALRFPRVVRLVPSRSVDDISTKSLVEEFYDSQ
jgi:ATP-dependent DNA ligase I